MSDKTVKKVVREPEAPEEAIPGVKSISRDASGKILILVLESGQALDTPETIKAYLDSTQKE